MVDFDVRPVLLANDHSMNSNVLAFEVGSRGINACFAEPRPSALGDQHAQVLRVTVVSLGVKEDLSGTDATLRPLDEHFHGNRFVNPLDGFDEGHVHPSASSQMRFPGLTPILWCHSLGERP